MRLKIKFADPDTNSVVLPCQYNELVQGFIYSHLDNWIGQKIHNSGFIDPVTKRAFKLFTFSRLIPSQRTEISDGNITFFGEINLTVCSPSVEFIESFATNLLKKEAIRLGKRSLYITSVQVEGPAEYSERILVKTLSPITIYSTLESRDAKKKTYYYSPFEKEFETLTLNNLNKKLRILKGRTRKEGSIKPYRVSTGNERVVIYKGTVIKGWDGIFELCLPEELFEIAFDCGIGSKNSQGFGCVEAHKEISVHKPITSKVA